MRILMITMSLFSILGCTHAQTQPERLALETVAEGVYVHHGQHLDIDTGYQGDICNISFIVGSKGVAVIDSGGSLKVGEQLHAAIRKVTPLPVLYVINTHVHPDHVYGNAAFLPKTASEPKPEFVGHEKLGHAMDLRREQYTKLNERFLHEDAKGSELIKPTLAVKNTTELDLGDRVLVLTAHPPAHTNTDLTVLDRKTGTLFAGDLLFITRTPVVEADIKGLIAEISKLKASPAQQVVPGHGPVTKDWVMALSNAERYLTVLLSDVRANIKRNISMEKTMDTAAESERDKWQLFEIANRRNVNTIYPMLEWE
nr:quinoprotein relay system zinc metallohydrolase 2 [uncultured Methylotenera sp.]